MKIEYNDNDISIYLTPKQCIGIIRNILTIRQLQITRENKRKRMLKEKLLKEKVNLKEL